MKTLDEVITALENANDGRVACNGDTECGYYAIGIDAFHYLKEYRQQKKIWKKLYRMFEKMFWGMEEEYPLDSDVIVNALWDAYSEGFEDEDN